MPPDVKPPAAPPQAASTGEQQLTIRLSELPALTPAERAELPEERAYRRGVHQAVALCRELVNGSDSLVEARQRLCRAERLAQDLRFKHRQRGLSCLLHYMRERLMKGGAA
jgi:hypothetical protein